MNTRVIGRLCLATLVSTWLCPFSLLANPVGPGARVALAAEAFARIDRTSEEPGDRGREARLRTFLRDHGSAGGVDRQVVALVELGELLWRKSCPITSEGGSCVEVGPPVTYTAPDRCRIDNRRDFTVHRRTAEEEEEAQQLFLRALALSVPQGPAWEHVAAGETEPRRGQRIDAMTAHLALASLRVGDRLYEKLAGLSLPAYLDFSQPGAETPPREMQKQRRRRLDATKRSLTQWIRGSSQLAGDAQKRYRQAIAFRHFDWSELATVRIGRMYELYGGRLMRVPLPKTPPTPAGMSPEEFQRDFVITYCDALGERADTLEQVAVAAYQSCVEHENSVDRKSEWAPLCEAELRRLQPNPWPQPTLPRGTPDPLPTRSVDPSPPHSAIGPTPFHSQRA